jgi:DNA-binding response OmpR family regulator
MESGDLLIDFQARLARRGGAPLPLSPREFALLSVFAANKDRALTREQILEALDGPGHVGDVRTVDVHVRWLRKKIEQEPGNPSRIVTVRGIGYRFDG